MDREDLQAALERWDTARAELAAFPFHTLTTHEKLAMVEHIEHAQRQDLALSHTVTAALLDDADPKVFGERSIPKVIATRLRITDADAGRPITDARDLGPRWTLTGERLPPRLSETAAALARGDIGARHVTEIQKALRKLPPWVGVATAMEAEQTLARLAVGLDPKNLRTAAEHLIALLDPDGDEPNDELQQRQRHFTIGKQQHDGMTPVKGMLDPETAALLGVVTSKRGAPGANMPADMAGMPDTRKSGQRHHDALKTGLRDLVGSGILGQINGFPATIVATVTVKDLEKTSGWAVTAGGARLPVRDVIRMAGQSQHYLAVFDDHHQEVLYLGRAKTLRDDCTAFGVVRPRQRLHPPRLHPTLLPLRSPPRKGLLPRRTDQHRRDGPGLPTRQPHRRRRRLDHPTPQRQNRMAPTPTTRHRTNPSQQLLPPRAVST